MGAKLDTLIDNYAKSKQNAFTKDTSDEEREELIQAVKKQLAQDIRNEIKAEVTEEAVKDAQVIIEKNSLLARINEYKKLSIDGLLIAFFVGMLVNQSTDLVGHLKGTVQLGQPWATVGICALLFGIVVGIFFSLFFAEIVKLLGKGKNESD